MHYHDIESLLEHQAGIQPRPMTLHTIHTIAVVATASAVPSKLCQSHTCLCDKQCPKHKEIGRSELHACLLVKYVPFMNILILHNITVAVRVLVNVKDRM